MLMYFAQHFIHQAFETDFSKGVIYDKSRQSVCLPYLLVIYEDGKRSKQTFVKFHVF